MCPRIYNIIMRYALSKVITLNNNKKINILTTELCHAYYIVKTSEREHAKLD